MKGCSNFTICPVEVTMIWQFEFACRFTTFDVKRQVWVKYCTLGSNAKIKENLRHQDIESATYSVLRCLNSCTKLCRFVVTFSNFHASRSNGISMRQQSVIKNIEEGEVSWCCYVVQNQCNPFCFTKEKKGKPSV